MNILKNCFKTVFFFFFFSCFLLLSLVLHFSVFIFRVFKLHNVFYSDICVLHVCDSCYGICVQNIFIISYRLLVIIIS